MKRYYLLFLLFIPFLLFAGEEIDLFTHLLNLEWIEVEKLLDRNPHLLDKQGEEEFITSLGGHLVSSVGRTPLSFAVEYDLDLMTVRLLEYGADTEAPNHKGWTPIMISSYLGNVNVTRLLLEWGAEVEVFDSKGLSPLALAVSACRFETADILLEWDADLYEEIPEVFPLAEDIYRRKIRIRDSLRILDTGVFSYPLFQSIEKGDYSLARTMLLQGMDPDSPDSQGVTPLMKAASLDNAYLTELLIDNGARTDRADIYGLSPLSAALFYGRTENVNLILKGGADINGGDNLDDSPLYYAIIGGDGELAFELIRRGCTLSRRDGSGRTALMYAAFLGNWKMTGALLRAGANASSMDRDGNNAVYYAMTGYRMTKGDNYYTITDSLIEAGASSGEYVPLASGERRFIELLKARWRD